MWSGNDYSVVCLFALFSLKLLCMHTDLSRYSIALGLGKEELRVTIGVRYSKPSDFSLDPPNYRAGSSVTLTCRVEGMQEGLMYIWSSTCTHSCFVKGRTTQSVTRHGLRSVDSSTHTCAVIDTLGSTGNATIDMNVIGKAPWHALHFHNYDCVC